MPSSLRVGYALAVVLTGLVPVHFAVSCAASRAIGDGAGLLFLVIVGNCVATRRGAAHRFGPLGFALAALLGHMLSAH